MSGGKAPHQGYNHNVRHHGHVFHVQTEDSGGKNPHIETHVFYEGIIISSKRTPYADYLGEPNADAAVRRLMQDQHKALLKDLRGGALDEKIAEMLTKHKSKQPRDETVPFGMKPLKGDPPTGDLPIAAPPDPKPRRPSTPPPAARPPVAAPPVRRHDPAASHPPATQRSGVIVARPARMVGAVPTQQPVTRSALARPGTASHAAVSAPVAPPPARPSEPTRIDIDEMLLRYLMEDLERGE